jgi:hypothetical protein
MAIIALTMETVSTSGTRSPCKILHGAISKQTVIFELLTDCHIIRSEKKYVRLCGVSMYGKEMCLNAHLMYNFTTS